MALGMRLSGGSRATKGEGKIYRQPACFPDGSGLLDSWMYLLVSRMYLLELGPGINQQVWRGRLEGRRSAGSTGDMGRGGGSLQLVSCCRGRDETWGIGFGVEERM